MKEEIPKCNSCGQPMFEIAELAGDIQIWEPTTDEQKLGLIVAPTRMIGIRHPKLYQCPECKDIKIN